jgi:aminopeptidase N
MSHLFSRLGLAALAAGLALCAQAAAAAAAAAPASAAPAIGRPYSFDTAGGRLPKNVLPLRYSVAIVPDSAALTTSGDETVVLKFRSATNTIQFNSLHQVLSGVTLDGKPVATVASDDEAQLTTVTLAAPAAAGEHTLRFHFTGRIGEQPTGLFRQGYVTPAGQPGTMLTTQMESIYARQMFPCWDEPAFRARFELSVTAPASLVAVSNMPVVERKLAGELATTRFAATPAMPSYLIELTVGDIAAVTARSGGTDFGVWAVRGQESGGQYALANAQQILADYNDYFGVRYPLPKLDSIAIPGGFGGAMENWGAITYNEQVLLLTPASTMGQRQDVYSVQAHEMAHQWFGDLVTMGWWDEIWLNESFASWMAAKQTDRRNPDWHWWLGQDDSKEDAMSADAIASVHPILQHVTDENLIDNTFDPQITYSKGQAILRMLEAWLGPDTFRDGVRRYMKQRAYSNATSADLWQSLAAASHRDVAGMAASWTQVAGYPVVSVAAHCDAAGARTLDLAQERFLSDGSPGGASAWNIPLQLRSGVAGTAQAVVMGRTAQGLPAGRCGEALSLNAGAIGYFRVNYDAATLAANTREFGRLPAADRVVLLDDQWALASAGLAPLASYLALAGAQGEELTPRAWEQVAGALESIEIAERGTPGHDAFMAYARSVLQPVFARLGWLPREGETPDLRRLRRIAFRDLGHWGDPAVVAEARKRFAAFLADHKAVAPDDQAVMLSVVARHADAATFEQLYGLAKGTRDAAELRRFYSVLTDVADPALAQRVIDIALGDALPPQLNSMPMQLVFGLAQQHQALSWQAFTTHSDKLLAPMPMSASMIIAQYSPQIWWSGVPLSDIETFARAHVPANTGELVDRGLLTARGQLKRKATLVSGADAYLAK